MSEHVGEGGATNAQSYIESYNEIIPGLSVHDYEILHELGVSRYTSSPYLDLAFTEPARAHQQLRESTYQTVDEYVRNEDLAFAIQIAESGIAWRITSNPKIPDIPSPTQEVLDKLSLDKDFRQRRTAWWSAPNDRHSYLYMQSKFLQLLAKELAWR